MIRSKIIQFPLKFQIKQKNSNSNFWKIELLKQIEYRYLAGEDLGLADRDFDLFPVTLLPDFCESGVLLLDLSCSSSESLRSS